MTIEVDRPEEPGEEYLGLTTLQCAWIVVAKNPQIEWMGLRRYFYTPGKPTKDDVIGLNRQTFLDGTVVAELIENCPERWNIAFDSKVEDTNGNVSQLPMMDLTLRRSPENLDRTKERLKELIVPDFGGGFILETEKSYHFLGKRLLSHEEWLKFLGFNLLTSIVTVTPNDQENIHELVADYRYIGHSLIRGSTGLRITAGGSKTVLPKVVAVI